jgi:hypothetical protein
LSILLKNPSRPIGFYYLATKSSIKISFPNENVVGYLKLLSSGFNDGYTYGRFSATAWV